MTSSHLKESLTQTLVGNDQCTVRLDLTKLFRLTAVYRGQQLFGNNSQDTSPAIRVSRQQAIVLTTSAECSRTHCMLLSQLVWLWLQLVRSIQQLRLQSSLIACTYKMYKVFISSHKKLQDTLQQHKIVVTVITSMVLCLPPVSLYDVYCFHINYCYYIFKH